MRMPMVRMMLVVRGMMVAMMRTVPVGRVRPADTCEQQKPDRDCKYSAHDWFS
jgi:hypothetical protein